MRALALILGLLPATLAAQEAPRPVVSEIVAADTTPERMFPGTVRAPDEAALAFQTAGRIDRLLVEAGDRVRKGQVLATLDQVTLKEDLASARAALSAAEAAADLGQKQLDRARKLAGVGVTSTASLEQSQANRDSTAAQLESAKADLAQAEEAARYGALEAPRDGVVLSTALEAGTQVSSGTQVLVLADLTAREAEIDLPEGFAATLSPGARFQVSHHATGVAPVAATLRLIEPVTDTDLDTRPARLTLIDPPPDYRIGSLVTATYRGDGEGLLTVPRAALMGGDDAPSVWRVSPDGRVVRRVPVTLGAAIGARVIVTGGLSPGDEVVIRGVSALEDGEQVGERMQ